MPDPRPAKKTSPPDVETPPPPAEAPQPAAARQDVDTKREPHELFWEAGQRLFQALQRGGEEARSKLASAYREQQQHLWDVHSEAQKRAQDLRHEYWSALNRATGEDQARIYQEATQRYNDGLWEIQSSLRKEWETAVANYQGTFTSLLESIEGNRITAFNGYKHACQRAWSEIDPNTLTCESLATIGQSFLMSARFVGARTHVS